MYSDPEIGKLSKEEFKLLLKHKYLNVVKEDQVLQAVCLWIDYKLNNLSPVKDSINLTSYPTKRNDTHESSRLNTMRNANFENRPDLYELNTAISEILHNVNWDFVSLPMLLEIIKSKQILRTN